MSSIHQVGPFKVSAWSIAGNETAVAVSVGNLNVCFDIGYVPRPMIFSNHVFISHGHIDHIGAIAQHMRKRHLNRLPMAKYYMSPSLIDKVRLVCKTFHEIHGEGSDFLINSELVPISPGEKIKLELSWTVEAIQTRHSVKSQGYILYYGNGDEQPTPEIAYLGDTTAEVFTDPKFVHPNLLSTRLLITESTYMDKPAEMRDRAAQYGHTHIDDIRQNAELFRNVEYLFLMHPSDRYSVATLHRLVHQAMPGWLARKMIIGTWAKQAQEI